MRTHAPRTGVRPIGASAAMPMIDIGIAQIAIGPHEAGVARPSHSGRAGFRGQDICGIPARTLHRVLGGARRSAMGVSDRFRGLAAGELTRPRQELLSHQSRPTFPVTSMTFAYATINPCTRATCSLSSTQDRYRLAPARTDRGSHSTVEVSSTRGRSPDPFAMACKPKFSAAKQ